MFIKNTLYTFTWRLDKTATPLVAADYDIHLIESPLGVTYTNGDLTSYTAPTETTYGFAYYELTPDAAGLWRMQLVTGTDESWTVLGKRYAWVFDAALADPRSPHCHHIPRNYYTVKPTIPA